MVAHELKIWPEYFEAVVLGTKTFELRKHDRPFCVGDVLVLKEWSPVSQSYTGQVASVKVTYLLPGNRWGLVSDDAELVILGIKPIAEADLLLSKKNLTAQLAAVTRRLGELARLAETLSRGPMASPELRELHALAVKPVQAVQEVLNGPA